MTTQEIKQITKREYGSMAQLGRKLSPAVTGGTISLVIDGRRTSRRLSIQIAKALKIKIGELNAAQSESKKIRCQAESLNKKV